MRLTEIFNNLLKEAENQNQALNRLKGANIKNPENILSQFVAADKNNSKKLVPIMAYIYANGYTDIKNILDVVNKYNDLESKKRVKPIQITKNGLVMGNKSFGDFKEFSEYINGEATKYSTVSSGSSVANDFKAKNDPIWSGNGIDIYNGDEVGKCITYTQGGLTGKGYSFCIGQGGNTEYKSYRDSKTSSFYFIVDRNHFKTNEDGSVNLDDPLHIVVFDRTRYGVELTDADNNTGNIAEYGSDADAYVNYLESKGVPVDKLVNRPKTSQEEEEEELLGRPNSNLDWFKKLPIEYKSAYIGRGHRLTDAQFDYLIGA
jgi:hypothetical protein